MRPSRPDEQYLHLEDLEGSVPVELATLLRNMRFEPLPTPQRSNGNRPPMPEAYPDL